MNLPPWLWALVLIPLVALWALAIAGWDIVRAQRRYQRLARRDRCMSKLQAKLRELEAQRLRKEPAAGPASPVSTDPKPMP